MKTPYVIGITVIIIILCMLLSSSLGILGSVIFVVPVAVAVGLITPFLWKLSKRSSKTESENINEAKTLRKNTNYKYTRKLTEWINGILTIVFGLSFVAGLICLGIWVYKEINRGWGSEDRDDFLVFGLALIILTTIIFLVSKLLLEMTNMMTDVADSNVKLVSQMKELIVMKNRSAPEIKPTEAKKPSEPAPEIKPTEAKKPSEPAPEVKPTEAKKPSSETKNISNFDSGAPPMV